MFQSDILNRRRSGSAPSWSEGSRTPSASLASSLESLLIKLDYPGTYLNPFVRKIVYKHSSFQSVINMTGNCCTRHGRGLPGCPRAFWSPPIPATPLHSYHITTTRGKNLSHTTYIDDNWFVNFIYIFQKRKPTRA